MLKSNELRIGNRLLHDRSVIIVDTIGYESINCDAVDDGILFENLQAITLTPEILGKFGFEKCSCGGYKNDGLHISKDDKGRLYYKQVKLVTLHQLQNLYFALNSEELKFNKT